MAASFDLIKEPWIPCIAPEGTLREYGLLETLINAHDLCEIYDPCPLVTISLYRLLLAMLHRNFGPATAEDWFAMWSQGHFEPKTLEAYFKKWEERFDLFSDKHPFYQVAGFKKGELKPIGFLAQEIASGNNPTLFDHTVDENPQQMSTNQAARLLVTRQNFSPTSGKSPTIHTQNAPLVGGVITFIVGNNLFESLMLNLIRYNPDEDEPFPAVKNYDMPIWERAKHIEPGKVRRRGYLDYLTWQSRCIRLLPASDDASFTDRLYFAQGLVLEDEGKIDPFMAYREDVKRGWLPLQLREQRALWRDSTALLQSFENKYRPKICDWIANLIYDSLVDPSQYYKIHLFGMARAPGKVAKIIFWRQERLPLPLVYLEKPELVAQIADALDVAEETATILRKAELLLATLVQVPGAVEEKQRRDKSDTIQDLLKSLPGRNMYWAELESPFKLLMAELPRSMSTSSENDSEGGRSEAFVAWVRTVEQVAKRAFAQDLEGLDRSARSLKAITRAQTDFNIRLFSFLKESKEVKQNA